MVNLILCGGVGKRLYPISTFNKPKQFLELSSGETLFSICNNRNKDLCNKVYVSTNIEYKKYLDHDYKGFYESIPLNTAAGIISCTLDMDPNELVLVTPSDHIIDNLKEYKKVISQAEKLAEKDYIVTLGIVPEFPNSNYGYIQYKDNNVISFKEKPDKNKAKKYFESGNFYWNSGIYCYKASVFLKQVQKANRNLYTMCLNKDYKSIIPVSIDYAVIEKLKNMKVIKADIGWQDLGSYKTFTKLIDSNL